LACSDFLSKHPLLCFVQLRPGLNTQFVNQALSYCFIARQRLGLPACSGQCENPPGMHRLV
jgi:hypothetical protein